MEQKASGRVNFLRKFKLYEATTDDEFYPMRKYIWFKNGYAYASNGKVAIRANIADISTFSLDEQMMLEGKIVKGDVFRRVLSHDEVAITEEGFDADVPDGNGILYRFSTPLLDEEQLPDVDKLINEIRKMPQTDRTKVIGYNVENIVDISKAMGTDRLKIRIKDADHSMIVEPLGSPEDIIGLVAPMIVDAEAE